MTTGAQTGSVLCVVGARPNFMKIAPIMAAFAAQPQPVFAKLVHTGQHYDGAMNDQFFEALDIPRPDINLDVGSASHAIQTADIMRRFEPVIDAEQPRAILVVGDVNSTIACALVAAKKQVPVIHVEAGLRSFDRTMPEEVNRVLTDQISDLLFITEESARANLLREGILDERIHFVGNVMIDTLYHNLARAVPARDTLVALDESRWIRGYAVLTLHRPSNVDDKPVLRKLLEVVRQIGEQLPVVFPLHPRTKARVEEFGLSTLLSAPEVLTLPPLGYLHMLGLTREARLVMTDSGGLQEETTALGVPCITLRNNTERPITVEHGTNSVVGQDPVRILSAAHDILSNGGKSGRIPVYWDGKASQRIKQVLNSWLSDGTKREVA
ncbi:MAG: non-hydrolyzing UDP-N-acetylglucosamine 2-epimerase [Burkholderiales bacterium]